MILQMVVPNMYLANVAGKEHPEGEGGGRFLRSDFRRRGARSRALCRERLLNSPLGTPAILAASACENRRALRVVSEQRP